MTDFPFPARRFRQRLDARLLPFLCFIDEVNPSRLISHEDPHAPVTVGTVELFDVFNGFDVTGSPAMFQRVAVTLPDGTRVPAYKLAHDGSYSVCQDFNHKAIKSS